MTRMTQIFFRCCLLLSIVCSIDAKGQLLDPGAKIDDFTLTTIYGESVNLYQYLDQGYMVVIDLSATWCGPCWAFEQTGTLKKLYEQYGPEGTINPGKIMPIFIEADVKTTLDDLKGTGTNTRGDWVTGNPYPIIDLSSSEVLLSFLKPGSTSFNTPSFLIICTDRSLVFSGDGLGAVTESLVIDKMNYCQNATAIQEPNTPESVQLYPNPAQDQLHIALGFKENTPISMCISTITGRQLINHDFIMTQAVHTEVLDISSLSSGIFVLTVNSVNGPTQHVKFIKR